MEESNSLVVVQTKQQLMRHMSKSCTAFSATFTLGDNRQRLCAPKPRSPCRRVVEMAYVLLVPLSCALSLGRPPEWRFRGHVCMSLYLSAFIHVCNSMSVYVHVSTRMHAFFHVCVPAFVCAYMCVCTCVCVHVHVLSDQL